MARKKAASAGEKVALAVLEARRQLIEAVEAARVRERDRLEAVRQSYCHGVRDGLRLARDLAAAGPAEAVAWIEEARAIANEPPMAGFGLRRREWLDAIRHRMAAAGGPLHPPVPGANGGPHG